MSLRFVFLPAMIWRLCCARVNIMCIITVLPCEQSNECSYPAERRGWRGDACQTNHYIKTDALIELLREIGKKSERERLRAVSMIWQLSGTAAAGGGWWCVFLFAIWTRAHFVFTPLVRFVYMSTIMTTNTTDKRNILRNHALALFTRFVEFTIALCVWYDGWQLTLVWSVVELEKLSAHQFSVCRVWNSKMTAIADSNKWAVFRKCFCYGMSCCCC